MCWLIFFQMDLRKKSEWFGSKGALISNWYKNDPLHEVWSKNEICPFSEHSPWFLHNSQGNLDGISFSVGFSVLVTSSACGHLKIFPKSAFGPLCPQEVTRGALWRQLGHEKRKIKVLLSSWSLMGGSWNYGSRLFWVIPSHRASGWRSKFRKFHLKRGCRFGFPFHNRSVPLSFKNKIHRERQ